MAMDRGRACFRCKECSEIVAQGKCGEHRIETGHEEFLAIDKFEDDNS